RPIPSGMLTTILAAAALALAGRSDTSGLMARGVSHELATLRARQVSDVRYDLRLDLAHGDTAAGTVRVSFALRQLGDVILDFRGPRLRSVSVNGRTLTEVESNGAHIRLSARVLRAGRNDVAITFATLVAPAGAPVIRFHDETDGRDYLYTL